MGGSVQLMAIAGNLISKKYLDTSTIYSSGRTDTSTNYWSYAFGNSIYYRVWAGSANNIYVPHPAVALRLWRYSISGQAWVLVHADTMGRDSACVYTIRCNKNPYVSSDTGASYNGDDSYLFAFVAYTYQGERGDCSEQLFVYNVGADTTYDNSVKGKKIYARNEDYAFKYHLTSGGGHDANPSISLTDSWLRTDTMAGTKITPALIKRMISVKSAVAFT